LSPSSQNDSLLAVRYPPFATYAKDRAPIIAVASAIQSLGHPPIEVVGFSAARLRAEALEPELKAAILEIGKNSTYDSIGS
jgi:hypothetical protein